MPDFYAVALPISEVYESSARGDFITEGIQRQRRDFQQSVIIPWLHEKSSLFLLLEQVYA